jgi:membrane protein implicated in regulation of membrane protease activity
MPPVDKHGSAQLGWKAFFALFAIVQVVSLGVMWRTYDAVQSSSNLAILHDYQINKEIVPAIKDLQSLRRSGLSSYQAPATQGPSSP